MSKYEHKDAAKLIHKAKEDLERAAHYAKKNPTEKDRAEFSKPGQSWEKDAPAKAQEWRDKANQKMECAQELSSRDERPAAAAEHTSHE